jgi:phage/plasmid-like protein (TIGR03299 family)
MFYVNERPWHRLGTHLKAPPTSAQAIRAAGLDWAVAKVPLYVAAQTRLHELPDRFAVVRVDKLDKPDCPIFGLAGREYEPLQNAEAFEFFDPLVRDGSVTYETAGALGRGERVWILARLREDVEIVSGDTIERFLLLSNSHDGSSSLQVKLTPVRVVCNNTLTLALSKGRSLRIRHDQDVRIRLEAARTFLGLVRADYEEAQALFRCLARTKLTSDRAVKYLEQVFPLDEDSASTRRAENRRRWAYHLFEHGKGHDLDDVKGTLWAAYNGVTELVDHCRSRRGGPDTSLARLSSVWFGAGAAIKGRALKVADEWSVSAR